MQPNRKIGEKQDEMGRPLGKNGCKQTSKEVEKHQGRRKRGRPQLRWENYVKRDMRRSGEEMKDGEREQPIENYGKKEQKEWLDNILPDPHPCTAGNKEEETVPDPHPCTAGNKEEETVPDPHPCTAGNKEEETVPDTHP